MAVRFHEARYDLLGLAFDGLQFARGVRDLLLGIRLALLPKHLEHGVRSEQQLLRRPHGIDKPLEVSFQCRFADVLARLLAPLGEAPIIGVARALTAPRPRCRHRPVAAGAVDEAAQREVIAHIGTIRRNRLADVQTLVNLEEGFVGNQRLMLGRDAIHSPFRHAHVPGIEHLRENLRYLLRMHGAEAVFGEDGIVLQEALHLGLRFEAAGCKAVQRFLDDTGERLSRHEHLAAVPGHTVITIADGRRETPISVGSTRHHAVLGLLGVFLALVL